MPKKVHRDNQFCFRCFGVPIKIESNRADLLNRIERKIPGIFPVKWSEIPAVQTRHNFSVSRNPQTGMVSVSKDEESVCDELEWRQAFDALISKLRLTVAEFARQRVFLHAGVVGWRGRAIILPGRSFAGKTTLVAELAKNGCEYFSDEYALIDRAGMVHPFPKKLSMRGIIDDYRQVDIDVEKLGGKKACKPLPAGFVLLSEYKKGRKRSKLEQITLGEGIMGCIANSISIRRDPKFVIEILNKSLTETVVLKAARGEVSDFVKMLLRFLEKNFQQ